MRGKKDKPLKWQKKLKGYATSKSRSCLCLHFRPKDDVVVSILAQGKSLCGSKMLRCWSVFRRNAPKMGCVFRKERFPLYQNQNNNKTQAYVYVNLDLSDLWLWGLGAFLNRQVEVRRLQSFKPPKKPDRAKKHWVNTYPFKSPNPPRLVRCTMLEALIVKYDIFYTRMYYKAVPNILNQCK